MRHLWYLNQQLITLALTGTELEDSNIREANAKVLHSTESVRTKTGKQTSTALSNISTEARDSMPSLVGDQPWLALDLLQLRGSRN